MTHQPTPQPHQWVSVGEASRRLNVSPSTVRRMIEGGQLVGERQVIGGSRERFLVRLDASGEASGSEAPSESGDAPTATTGASAAVMGLLAELGEVRRQHAAERAADASRIATLYAENAELRERVGRAEAASEAASSRADALRAELDRLRARPGWRAWWPW